MRACWCVCLAVLSFMFKYPQGAFSLNVDQAREELSARQSKSYSQMHDPTALGDRELAAEAEDEKEDAGEDAVTSILSDTDEAGEREDSGVQDDDDKLSFLEDFESSDLDDDDYDLDAMDDEDAQVIADSMQGDEQKAFLQRWETHKADRRVNGNPDEHGSFAEF